MIKGRISKFLAEASLVEQAFVKNPEIKVGELAKKAGAEIVSFTYFKVGEGIEKPVDNFAEEVAAQAGCQPSNKTVFNCRPKRLPAHARSLFSNG